MRSPLAIPLLVLVTLLLAGCSASPSPAPATVAEAPPAGAAAPADTPSALATIEPVVEEEPLMLGPRVGPTAGPGPGDTSGMEQRATEALRGAFDRPSVDEMARQFPNTGDDSSPFDPHLPATPKPEFTGPPPPPISPPGRIIPLDEVHTTSGTPRAGSREDFLTAWIEPLRLGAVIDIDGERYGLIESGSDRVRAKEGAKVAVDGEIAVVELVAENEVWLKLTDGWIVSISLADRGKGANVLLPPEPLEETKPAE